jgi:hypothetical protein
MFHGILWGSLRFYNVLVNRSVPTETNRSLTSYTRLQKLSNGLNSAIDSLCNPMRALTNTDKDYTRWMRFELVVEKDSPNMHNSTHNIR